MVSRSKVIVISAALIGLVAGSTGTHAWMPLNQITNLTFHRAVALPGVELTAGTYTFEIANPMSSNNVVRVSSRDKRKTYALVLTNAIERPASLKADQSVMFGEAARGAAAPILAWFPSGSQVGREFIYPR